MTTINTNELTFYRLNGSSLSYTVCIRRNHANPSGRGYLSRWSRPFCGRGCFSHGCHRDYRGKTWLKRFKRWTSYSYSSLETWTHDSNMCTKNNQTNRYYRSFVGLLLRLKYFSSLTLSNYGLYHTPIIIKIDNFLDVENDIQKIK